MGKRGGNTDPFHLYGARTPIGKPTWRTKNKKHNTIKLQRQQNTRTQNNTNHTTSRTHTLKHTPRKNTQTEDTTKKRKQNNQSSTTIKRTHTKQTERRTHLEHIINAKQYEQEHA